MKKLTFLLILVLLAATGCRKNSSEPGTMADQTVQCEPETMADQTVQSEPELSETLPSDEETTAAETAGEPETSPPPATETQPEEKRFEFDYELIPQSEYIMYFGSTLTREGDVYIITGEKMYGYNIWLTWQQKALLDAGAVMNMIYEGKVVDQVTAEVGEWPDRYDGPIIFYRGKKGNERGVMYCRQANSQSSDIDDEVRELISSEPYNGVAFWLVDASEAKTFPFHVIVDDDFRVEVSGDTPIYPGSWLTCFHGILEAQGIYEEMCNKDWTVEEFYEVTVKSEYGDFYFEIYEEDGKVVRIDEPYMG